MFDFLTITRDNIVAFKASGKIEKTDYEKLNLLLDKTEKEHDALRLFIQIGEITGITAGALLKDIATYFRHIRKIEKVAVVGDHTPEKAWAKIADPFIKADIQYFATAKMAEAETWIRK